MLFCIKLKKTEDGIVLFLVLNFAPPPPPPTMEYCIPISVSQIAIVDIMQNITIHAQSDHHLCAHYALSNNYRMRNPATYQYEI